MLGDKKAEAYEIKKIVLNSEFWSKEGDIITVGQLLIKVFCLVDEDEKPMMGFIYEVVDRAKLGFIGIVAIIRRTKKSSTIYGISNYIMVSMRLV